MNHELDLSRWMVIGRSEETGLGRLFADFTTLFPEMQRAVQPSFRFAQGPVPAGARRIPSDADDAALAAVLEGIDGIVLFENPEPASIIRVAYQRGIASVFVPMWEWFNPAFPDWNLVTRFACPNEMCVRVLRKLGIGRLHPVTWPADFSKLPRHQISGPARVFVHNSGILEKDDRKACKATIEAFSLVKGDDLRLIVRTQNDAGLQIKDPRIDYQCGHLPSKNALYEIGDVLVQPSKAEGLGFAILEGMACGFPVVTLDYPPMNEYIVDRRFLASPKWGSEAPVQQHYIPQAHLKVPRVRALARCIEWCARNDVGEAAQRNLRWISETFDPAKLRAQWAELLQRAGSEARK